MSLSAKRNPAMDVIRCFSLFCVVSVHFFLYNGFYGTPIEGMRMFLMLTARCFFMICIPLFLMLSGYLLKDKRPTKAYFSKIFKTYGIYAMATFCVIVYVTIISHESFAPTSALKTILDFSATNYTWYMEMYLGLFFLIPFLNVLYSGLKNRQEKQLLLAVLALLTVLPGMANVHNITDLAFWLHPADFSDYHQLIPQWWTGIYPITMYYLGTYLREYPLKLGAGKKLLFILLTALLTGLLNFYRSYGAGFIRGSWQTYQSLPNLIQAILVFSLFAELSYHKLPAPAARILAICSDWTLGAYLVSWIFDQILYQKFFLPEPAEPGGIGYYLIWIPVSLVCSLILSGVLNFLYRFLAAFCRQLAAKFAKKERVR